MPELTDNQEIAIAALLSEATIGAAAAKVGVTARTINEWQRQPHFAAAYREARRQARPTRRSRSCLSTRPGRLSASCPRAHSQRVTCSAIGGSTTERVLPSWSPRWG